MKPCAIIGGRPWVNAPAEALCARRQGWHYWPEAKGWPTAAWLRGFAYAFFVHCSRKVPKEVLEATTCVGFHMTDLPQGRGGTPLQHLILAGKTDTVLTAFRMTEEMDAGPIYRKDVLCLNGAAEEVYARAIRIALRQAEWIADVPTEPSPQVGTPTVTRRRTPAESELLGPDLWLDPAYDMIRMLDAEGYPHAFLRLGRLRFTFRRAVRYHDRVVADCTITEDDDA